MREKFGYQQILEALVRPALRDYLLWKPACFFAALSCRNGTSMRTGIGMTEE